MDFLNSGAFSVLQDDPYHLNCRIDFSAQRSEPSKLLGRFYYEPQGKATLRRLYSFFFVFLFSAKGEFSTRAAWKTLRIQKNAMEKVIKCYKFWRERQKHAGKDENNVTIKRTRTKKDQKMYVALGSLSDKFNGNTEKKTCKGSEILTKNDERMNQMLREVNKKQKTAKTDRKIKERTKSKRICATSHWYIWD